MLAGRYPFPVTALDAMAIRAAFESILNDLDPGSVELLSPADLFSVQIDMIALWAEMMLRHAELAAANNSLASAIDGQAVLDIALAHHGYEARGLVAAKHRVRITAPSSAAFTMNVGDVIGTSGSPGTRAVRFEVDEAVHHPVGETDIEVIVRHGTRKTTEATASGVGGQIIALTEEDIDDSTITVTVGGEPWTRVASFASSLPSDPHWRLDQQFIFPWSRRYRIMFPDGIAGRLPTPGLKIAISYVDGVSLDGNVPVGAIDTAVTPKQDEIGSNLNLQVTHLAQTTRARKAEPISMVRLKAPLLSQIHGGVVAKADYAAAALTLPSNPAVRAVAYNRADVGPNWDPNAIAVLAMTDLTDPLSEAELAQLEADITTHWKTNGTSRLVAAAPTFQDEGIKIKGVLASGQDPVVAKAALSLAAAAFFSLDAVLGDLVPAPVVQIGQPISVSPLLAWLGGLKYFKRIELPEWSGALTTIAPSAFNNVLRVTPDVEVA